MKSYYTTSETAKLLSVSSDTVLKWVKAGKILSYRTPGGHSRIPAEAIQALLPDRTKVCKPVPREIIAPDHRYCWEFNSSPEGINPECLECVAYRSRALRCYEIKDIPGKFGPLKKFCSSECSDCDYYKTAHDFNKSVLLISRSTDWMDNLIKQSSQFSIVFKTAGSEYECASRIGGMRPDYVVIDCEFGTTRTRQMCRHIIDDPRLPLTKIILASKIARIRDYCEDEIWGWISKPFSFDQLNKMIDGTNQNEINSTE